MRASFYRGPRVFEPGTAPMPEPAAGDVLLKVRRVGICGSDLHIFQGHLDHRVPKNNIIGHEVLAEIAAAPAASDYTAGERVVVDPVLSCGVCRSCRRGVSHLCARLKVMGVDAPGGMAEFWAVPEDRLFRVPEHVSDDVASLIEPLSVATHDVGRAGVRAGDAVVVVGGGPIGTLIALVCRHRGARVRVSEINPFRVEKLRALGFDTIGPGEDPIEAVAHWTDGEGADIAFEVSGSPDAVVQITRLVRPRGLVSIIAIHADPVVVNLYPMFSRELTMQGSRLSTHESWHEAIALVAENAFPLDSLVSRRISLESLQQGMEEALGGGPVMKVSVDMAV